MGFLDKLVCEYALPLPEEAADLEKAPDWCELEFYTSSLNNTKGMFDGFIDEYSIEEDGQIYKKDLQREFVETEAGVTVNEIDNGIEKVTYTGELAFGTTLMESEYDHYIEFVALFWKGDLKEIKLEEWNKTSNAARLKAHEKLKTVTQRRVKNKSSKLVELIKAPLKCFFIIIKYILGFIIKCVWWLERKII